MSEGSWGGRYELAFGIGLALLLTYGAAQSTIPDVLAEVERRGYSAFGVLAALCCFAAAAWAAGWYFAGPLGISTERLQWTIWRRDPTAWLAGDLRRVLVIGAVLAGAVASLAALSLGGVVGSSAAWFGVALWTLLQALVLAVLKLQHVDLDGIARAVPATFGMAGVGLSALQAWGVIAAVIVSCCVLGILAAGSPGWFRLILQPPQNAVGTGALTPRWQLHRGARNRWSARAGVTMLDAEIVRVVGQRDGRAAGRSLPRLIYRSGWPFNLMLVVGVRTLRPVVIAAAFALPFAFAVHEFLGPVAAVSVLVLLEFLATVTMTRSAQAWLSHRALRRTWATDDNRVSIALATPSVLCCALIALIATAWLALPPLVTAILIVLPGAILGRRHQASKPTTHLTLLSTPAGALPLQTMNRVLAGPDAVLVALLAASTLL